MTKPIKEILQPGEHIVGIIRMDEYFIIATPFHLFKATADPNMVSCGQGKLEEIMFKEVPE